MPDFYRRDTVVAHQLRWDNWQAVAKITGGRFVQGMTIEKSTGNASNGRAYLLIPKGGDEPGERRVEMNWWVVNEGDEWIGMPSELFHKMYYPSNQIGM